MKEKERRGRKRGVLTKGCSRKRPEQTEVGEIIKEIAVENTWT